MKQTAVVSGADRGLGFNLCKALLKRGFIVFAGQYMKSWPELKALKEANPTNLFIIPLDISSDKSVRDAAKLVAQRTKYVDLLINCAGISGKTDDIRDGYDYQNLAMVMNTNAFGALRMIENFLPLLDQGKKIVCSVSSEAGSIGQCWRDSEVQYCMSKAALNMGIKILNNRLSQEGYTFKLYHPGWMKSYMTGKLDDRPDLDTEYAAQLALKYFLDDSDQKLVLKSYNGECLTW